MDTNLTGKTAIVTGAGRGIGLAIVDALTSEGAQVVAGTRTVTEALKQATPHATAIDLATPQGPSQLVDHAVGELGGIDLLVNNLGGTSARTGGFLELDDDDWQDTFDLTLMSVVRTTRAALPSILERKGAIINIASVNARLPLPSLVAYSAAKAAVVNLSKALSEEFATHGVRVNAISPGPVWTDIWTQPGGPGEALADQAGVPLAAFTDQLPRVTGVSTEQFAEPEEIAALVVLLASGRVPNLNGSDLVIDGGMLKTT